MFTIYVIMVAQMFSPRSLKIERITRLKVRMRTSANKLRLKMWS